MTSPTNIILTTKTFASHPEPSRIYNESTKESRKNEEHPEHPHGTSKQNKNCKKSYEKNNSHRAVDLFTSAKRSSMAKRSLCSLKALAAKAPVAADTAPTAKPPPAKAALPGPESGDL